MEVTPTLPVLKEVSVHISQRNDGANAENMETRSVNLTRKRNLQVHNEAPSTNSFAALYNKELMNKANRMGVEIPDNNFSIIDVVRELDKTRVNLAEKCDNFAKQQDNILLTTNEAGSRSPLSSDWINEKDIDDDNFTIVRSRKKKERKVNVVISKSITRSQKNL